MVQPHANDHNNDDLYVSMWKHINQTFSLTHYSIKHTCQWFYKHLAVTTSNNIKGSNRRGIHYLFSCANVMNIDQIYHL